MKYQVWKPSGLFKSAENDASSTNASILEGVLCTPELVRSTYKSTISTGGEITGQIDRVSCTIYVCRPLTTDTQTSSMGN